MKDGRKILCREYGMSPSRALITDPCPCGLPEILPVAHIEIYPRTSCRVVDWHSQKAEIATCLGGLFTFSKSRLQVWGEGSGGSMVSAA